VTFLLPSIKGLKFPDEYVVRFFFKERLHQKPGRVLELGCGNGNNLMLFYQYGWETTGIDIDTNSLADAKQNFKLVDDGANGKYKFLQHDLSRGIPEMKALYDVILMPSVLYYIPRESMKKCLTGVRKLLKPGGSFYLRMRTLGDYRFGKGNQVERNGFVLDIAETGEKGLLNVFYDEPEIINMLKECMGIDEKRLKTFHLSYDNWQANTQISTNREMVVWGQVL
jgi:SAM-dependent methyltransferase